MNAFQTIRDLITKIEEFWNWCTAPFDDSLRPSQQNASGGEYRTNTGVNDATLEPTYRPDSEPSARNGGETIKAEKYSVRWWKDRLEIMGILGGLVVAILICLQYDQMVKSTRAAMGQLNEMHQSRIDEERAWVFQFQINGEPFPQNPSLTAFRVSYKNTGKTPAIAVHACIGLGYSLVSVTQVESEDLQTNSIHQDLVLAPDAVASVVTDGSQMIQKAIENIPNGTPLYVFGIIIYDDVFGRQHWTRFCYLVDVDWKSFRPTPGYNSCDDIEGDHPK